MKKVMKLLAFIFEQPSYNSLTLCRPTDFSIKFDTVKSDGSLYILRDHSL